MTETVRIMAVIPLEEYKQLTERKSDENPMNDSMVNEDEESTTVNQEPSSGVDINKEDIPSSLRLILECAPSRTRRQALLILRYMARMSGRLKYDEDSGELVIDQKHKRGSNLCDIIRILLSNRPGYGRPRKSTGMKSFLRVLAESPIPANLIRDDHWRKYMIELRSQAAAVETETDSE